MPKLGVVANTYTPTIKQKLHVTPKQHLKLCYKFVKGKVS